MNKASTKSAERRPTTVKELLDREEALALGTIAGSLEQLSEDLIVATDLRERIREHPLLAAGLGAFVGFVAAPLTLRLAKRAADASAIVGFPAAAQASTLPDLVNSSLRRLRSPL